jgi:hypothetical protein
MKSPTRVNARMGLRGRVRVAILSDPENGRIVIVVDQDVKRSKLRNPHRVSDRGGGGSDEVASFHRAAVAGVVLGLWAWMARRSAAFQARAAAPTERAWKVSLACRINSKRLEHHEALARKYNLAARSPGSPCHPTRPN